MLKIAICFLTCISSMFQLAICQQSTQLKFVQILFRHGDRSPTALYPTDPNSVSFWPEGLGKLTKLGRQQQYALGNFFHKRYENFTTFSPLEIDVISSEVDRCLRSAETNLASFFAPDSKWTFEKGFNWQPIAVRYIPEKEDKYLNVNSYCPRAEKEKERVVDSPEGQQFISEHKAMFQNLTSYSGYSITNWSQASHFQDTIFIEGKYNLTIPTWINPYWEELVNVSNLSFFWSFNSPLLHRLRAGPFLQRVIETMNEKIAGNLPHLKFKVYSAHDSNIAVVLASLNLFNIIHPPYCSTLLFELHEMSNGDNAVRLLYLNSSKPEESIEVPHLLILDGCSEFCPLEFFTNYISHLIPDDWDQECQLDKTVIDKIKEQRLSIGQISILIGVVILAMGVFTLWRAYTRKRNKYAYHLMPMS